MLVLCYFYDRYLKEEFGLSLYKGGYLTLLFGILLLVASIFFTASWSFTAWIILFSVSLVLCTVGIILLIVHLIRQIKADNIKKTQ